METRVATLVALRSMFSSCESLVVVLVQIDVYTSFSLFRSRHVRVRSNTGNHSNWGGYQRDEVKIILLPLNSVKKAWGLSSL